MASAQHDSDEGPDSHDLRIVLTGVSGVRKSSTGNAILGREAFKEIRTRESEKQRGRVEDRNISIIDTPGFFNTQLTDEEMKKQMTKSLDLSDPGPHVFLLVINLENYKEEERRNLVEQIQENFGAQALKFTMVLFIGRETISRGKFKQITESENIKELLDYFEGRFHVMNSKNECDPSQITKLLKNIDVMMENNGGQTFSNEIYLKDLRKLREQKERVKYEEKSQKQEEERKTQEQATADAKKQIEGVNQEEEIKTKRKEERIKDHNERKKDDVKERAQYLRVKEDLGKQMESRRENKRQRWALEREMTPGHSRLADLRIVILGKCDVGKTATANTILGRDEFRAEAHSDTFTCGKREALVSGRSISITDTPGLLDAPWYNIFQHKLKRDIDECLEMSAPGPHVFLLVIKLNGRYKESEKDTVKWIQENFGEEAVRHTFVLFTHVDLLMGEPLDQYIRKSPDLQLVIDSCGGRFHSFNNQDRSDQNQVTELLEKIEQLVKDNRGDHYANEKRKKKPEEPRQDNSEEDTESDDELREKTGELMNLMLRLQLSEMALRLSLARAMAHSNLSRQDLRIVLLGFLAAGKSSTGNTILGRDVFRASLRTTTRSCEKQAAVVLGRMVSITDTPGLLDPLLFRHSHNHNKSDVEKSLKMSAPGPHVFLLVIGMEGFSREEKHQAKWFQENLEKDALNRTIILVTHADWLNVLLDEPLDEYIQKKKELKSVIDSCGGRYHTLNNRDRNNRGQVFELLQKIDEMVQSNGGKHYTRQNIFKRQDDTSDCKIL